MSKKPEGPEYDPLDVEIDFAKGVRGKYAQAFAKGTNIVVLDPDVAAMFPNSHAVNKALREVAKRQEGARSKNSRR